MRLFSLGYSGLTVPPVRAWLEQQGALLVDVRLKPFSRVPEWRQGALLRTLGPRYRHVPELGNLNYRSGPIQLADEAEGVRIVSALLEQSPVVLLCICAEYARCHRTVAAKVISEATGVQVVHLSPSDLASTRQLELL